jgi:predicted chitinase
MRPVNQFARFLWIPLVLLLVLLGYALWRGRFEVFETDAADAISDGMRLDALVRRASGDVDPGEVFGLNPATGEAVECAAGPPKKCINFYTWPNFLKAVDEYNRNARADGLSPAFAHPDNVNLISLAAFFANAHIESGGFHACKERVLINGRCDRSGDCSGGHLGHYTAVEAKQQGWTKDKCYLEEGGRQYDAPPQGCTDWRGNRVANARHCWFGRGALQISWPGNYGTYSPPGINLCEDPDLICRDPVVAWQASIHYWATKVEKGVADWKETRALQDSIEKIAPADGSMSMDSVGNKQRHQRFFLLLEKLNMGKQINKIKDKLPSLIRKTKANSRCGTSWSDANTNCHAQCNVASDCPEPNQRCFAQLKPCAGDDVPVTDDVPTVDATTAEATSVASDSPMVAMPRTTPSPPATTTFKASTPPTPTVKQRSTQPVRNISPNQGTYIVQEGDTCARIAREVCGRRTQCTDTNDCPTLCDIDCRALAVGSKVKYHCGGCQQK